MRPGAEAVGTQTQTWAPGDSPGRGRAGLGGVGEGAAVDPWRARTWVCAVMAAPWVGRRLAHGLQQGSHQA